MKICNKCGQEKLESEFRVMKAPWHVSGEYSHLRCKECERKAGRERAKVRYWGNAEVAREKRNTWRAENLEKARAKVRRCYASHCEEYRAKNRARYALDRDALRLRRRIWVHNNPQVDRNYYRNNIDKRRERNRVRYAMAGKMTEERIIRTKELNVLRFGCLTCYICRNPIDWRGYNIEHKVPIIRGGKNNQENLEIACPDCNRAKGTMTIDEFLKVACTREVL